MSKTSNYRSIRSRFLNYKFPIGGDSAVSETTGANKNTGNHVVILIHGIRTRPKWYKEIADVLEENLEIRVARPTYGYWSTLNFLSKKEEACEYPLGIIRDTYNNEKSKPSTKKISIIAHSFGSYLASELIKRYDVEIHRLIVCGSVIDEDFDWSKYQSKLGNGSNETSVINDHSKKDKLPKVASNWKRYGYAGTYGFHRSSHVQNREHSCGHSGYLNKNFARVYWKPFIDMGEVVVEKTQLITS